MLVMVKADLNTVSARLSSEVADGDDIPKISCMHSYRAQSMGSSSVTISHVPVLHHCELAGL